MSGRRHRCRRVRGLSPRRHAAGPGRHRRRDRLLHAVLLRRRPSGRTSRARSRPTGSPSSTRTSAWRIWSAVFGGCRHRVPPGRAARGAAVVDRRLRRSTSSHNVLATQRLLEAAASRRACAAWSTRRRRRSTATRTATRRWRRTCPRPYSPYGVTKLAAEHLCGLYAENWGVHDGRLALLHRLRPPAAPRHVDPPALRGRAHRRGFPRFGDGTQVREFTYVADIVAANLSAAGADVAPGTVRQHRGRRGDHAQRAHRAGGRARRDAGHRRGPAGPSGRRQAQRWRDRRGHRLLGWSPQVSLREGLAAQLAWHRARRQLTV